MEREREREMEREMEREREREKDRERHKISAEFRINMQESTHTVTDIHLYGICQQVWVKQ